MTRFGLVVKIGRFRLQNSDENWFRRQNREFFGSKWWRDLLSSPKKGVFDFKTATRFGFVAKKKRFSPQNGDEIWFRRQNRAFLTTKRRREWISSPKNEAFCPKTTTKIGLVAKKWSFLSKNDDENWPRRQKMKLSVQKRRRDLVSSPKRSVSHLKMVTRFDLVAKIGRFRLQNGDEIRSRRQNRAFLDSKRWRDLVSSPK